MTEKNIYVNDIRIGLIKPVRVLFPPALHEKRAAGDNSEPKYEIQVGLPNGHPDIEVLREIEKNLCKQKGWDHDTLESKLRNGDEEYEAAANHPVEKRRKEYPHLKGHTILKLRSSKEIAVFDLRRRDDKGRPVVLTDKDEIQKAIYGGCYVALTLTAATYTRTAEETVVEKGKKTKQKAIINGVSFYPEQVCFVADGEKIGGTRKTDGSVFASVQGEYTDENPYGEDADPAY